MSETETLTAPEPVDDFIVTSNSPVEAQAESEPAPIQGDEPDVDEAGEQTTQAEPEPDPASEAGKALAKKRTSLQARINELTRKAGEREREAFAANERAARLQRELEARLNPQQPQQASQLQHQGPPTVDQFENYDDFVKAQAVYAVRVEMWQAQQQQAAWQAQQQEQALLQTVQAREAAFVAEHADYYDVVNSVSIPETPTGQAIIAHLRHADLGPALAYELGSNPAVLAEIVSRPPGFAVAALGKLEYQIEARQSAAHSGPAVPPNVTQAKPLIKPVSGSPVASDDGEVPDDLSLDDHIKRMNARDRAARRR